MRSPVQSWVSLLDLEAPASVCGCFFYPITTPSEGVAARPVFPTPLEGVESAHRRYRDCGAVCRENAAATPSEGVAERPVFLTPSEGVDSACLRYCRSGGI